MRYEILDDEGKVINTIVADPSFVEANYPGKYRLVVDPNEDAILVAEEAARVEAEIKANLREIDSRSIRSLREYIAKKGDASEYLKTYEAKAGVERTKLVK